MIGAYDRVRTCGFRLGRTTLYQLSYIRINVKKYSRLLSKCQVTNGKSQIAIWRLTIRAAKDVKAVKPEHGTLRWRLSRSFGKSRRVEATIQLTGPKAYRISAASKVATVLSDKVIVTDALRLSSLSCTTTKAFREIRSLEAILSANSLLIESTFKVLLGY